MRGTKARVIPTLAFDTPDGLVGPPASPHPELHLEGAGDGARRRASTPSASVYGPRSATVVAQAARAAERLGLTHGDRARGVGARGGARAAQLVATRSTRSGCPATPTSITPQVFQYALRLQLERGLPVAAATRQQVHSGALVAADFSPRAAGRIAAELANRYLEGRQRRRPTVRASTCTRARASP